MSHRVLSAKWGESAVRILRARRESGVQTVVMSEAGWRALHVMPRQRLSRKCHPEGA